MKRSRPRKHIRRLSNGKKILVNKNYVKRKRKLYHGTTEENLAMIGLSGELKPTDGKLYLTDDWRYARFKARQKTDNTRFKPIILEVDEPNDLSIEGRHFVSKKGIKIRELKVV